MNLKDSLQMAAGELRSAGVPEPELDAWYLLEYVSGWNRASYYADPERELTARQQEKFAFVGQGHQLVGPGQGPFLAPAAQKQKIRMIVDIPLLVSDKHMGTDGGRCHM